MMHEEARRGIFWRNVLLAAVLVTFGRAVLAGFQPWLAVDSPKYRMIVLLLMGGGFFCAMGVRELAVLLFDADDTPVYAKRGGILLVLFSSMGVQMVWVAGYRVAATYLKLDNPYASPAIIHAAIASQVLFTLLLDWMPSLPRDASPSRMRRKPSKLKKLARWLFDKDNY